MELIVDFIKMLLPASIVLYAVYLLVRSFINKEIELKVLEVKGRSMETVLPNRLQAYERITLFLERIAPQSLLIRVDTGNLTAKAFHQTLLQEIRNEYNHNVSQQVYMSASVWELVKNAKEDLIVTINDAASSMSLESTSLDLSKKIFEKFMDKPEDLIEHALLELKKEIQQTF